MATLFPKDFVEAHGTEFPAWNLDDSLAYCRGLSGAHYENFHVVSLLLPKRLHQDFFNIYAYCRWADDLGDEFCDPQRSLELLEWWSGELDAMYAGRTRHPVFVALQTTVEKRGIPKEPFVDLVRAFVQDQTKTRYETYDEVLDYCVYSANPVGRLVLHLCGYADAERIALSDMTCTALQLANHWQDVRRDYIDRNRIYVPAEVLQAHRASLDVLEADLQAGKGSEPVRKSFADLVGRAQGLFEQGLPLADTLDRRLAIDIELFSRGGMAILEKIRKQDFDPVRARPRVGKLERVGLLMGVVGRRMFA
jgi:squalene synthase HpnC